MTTVIFHRLAKREAKAIEEYYSSRDQRAAIRFRDAVDRAWRRIALDPASLTVWKEPFRTVRVQRFPCISYFWEVAAGQIMILAIAHTSRRPGYWRRRTALP